MNLKDRLKNYQAVPYIILLGLMFGSNMVAARFSLGQLEANVFNSLRLIIVVPIFALVYALSPKRSWPKDKSLWLRAGIWGVIGLAVPMASFISSLKYQSSGVSSLLITLNVATTVLLAAVFLSDEPLNSRKLLGLVIAFAGAGLILIRGENGLSEFGKADWRGYVLVGIGVFFTSIGYIYARKFLQNGDQFQVVSIRMVIAALMLIPFTVATVGFNLSKMNLAGLLALLFSAVIGTYLTFQMEFYVVKRFSASAASQAAYVVPVVATSLGALLLSEHITAGILIGMGVIFLGIRLLN